MSRTTFTNFYESKSDWSDRDVVQFIIRLKRHERDMLDVCARHANLSRTEFVRRLVRRYAKENKIGDE